MENLNEICWLYKLHELLLEHCRKHYGFSQKDNLSMDHDSVSFHLYLGEERMFSLWAEKVICKEFWFIKYLVENEKVEWNEKFYLEDDHWLFGTYECWLMQLAIKDNPIEFLISILK